MRPSGVVSKNAWGSVWGLGFRAVRCQCAAIASWGAGFPKPYRSTTHTRTYHGRAKQAAEDPLVEDAGGADAREREAEERDDDTDGGGAAERGVDVEPVLCWGFVCVVGFDLGLGAGSVDCGWGFDVWFVFVVRLVGGGWADPTVHIHPPKRPYLGIQGLIAPNRQPKV